MTSFISELRRRNVLRVAATYAVVAWGIKGRELSTDPTRGAPIVMAYTEFGDYDKIAALVNPEFAEDADPVVSAFNVANLIRYAFILQNLGESQNADEVLVAALDVVRTLPRTGLSGHGIRDVQILALQGKTLEALAALRDAIDEGFRGTVASNGWPIAVDPYLSSLRGQPGFEAMVGELDDAIEVMRQRVSEAEQSGNWDELRALVAVWQSE